MIVGKPKILRRPKEPGPPEMTFVWVLATRCCGGRRELIEKGPYAKNLAERAYQGDFTLHTPEGAWLRVEDRDDRNVIIRIRQIYSPSESDLKRRRLKARALAKGQAREDRFVRRLEALAKRTA